MVSGPRSQIMCVWQYEELKHGDKSLWDKSEEIMRKAVEKSGIRYVEDIGGAAFYGPKIDFNIKAVTGREFSISTNQLDLYMPQRFNLTYTDSEGKEQLCVVIHRAPLGSHERFVGFLIEHFGGAFPTWLSPKQVMIIPITDKHNEYAQKIFLIILLIVFAHQAALLRAFLLNRFQKKTAFLFSS